MQLSEKEWHLLGRAVSFIYSYVGDRNMRPLVRLIGTRGKKGAAEGMDPLTGPPRHQIVHALRTLAAAVDEAEIREAKAAAKAILARCDGTVAVG